MPRPIGLRKTGGRKPGSKNVRTLKRLAAIAESGTDPLRYMLAIVSDETADPDRRDRMAVAAAPYTSPRLAVVDSTVRAKVEVSGTLSADELRARARAAIAEAFAERPLVVEHQPRAIAGRDVAKDVEQANGKASEERNG